MRIYDLKHIETRRLLIRPIQLSDEIPLNKAINNSLSMLQQWQAWANDPSIEATRRFIQQGAFAWKSQSIVNYPMVAIHKVDKKIIGASGYNDRSDASKGLYEIDYWCDIDYQGQGLITECANALTRYAFEQLQANKVIIMMQKENRKSLALAERLGFTRIHIKQRDPRDCVSEAPAENYIFSTHNTHNLPPLETTYEHKTQENTDTKIIAWAKTALNITDPKAFANSQIMVLTPWSMVAAINTGNARVYLKHTPPDLALESRIIPILHDQFQANVPEIIKHNAHLDSFLMKNAGQPLRNILKQEFNTSLYGKAINQFTSLQIASAKDYQILLDIGVPDWRLDKLSDLYRQLLSQPEDLIADGLTENEIIELKTLLPTLKSLCQTLANHGIEPGIVQPDFHDNNILIDDKTQNITFIDLGEIVISHPFFSLTNCLYQAKRHHGLTDEDQAYQQLMNACLKNFEIFAPKQNLFEALAIAHQLECVYQALAYHRLMLACDPMHLHSFHGYGRLSGPLKQFITACSQIDKP